MTNPADHARLRPVFVPFADQGMYLAHTAGGQHSVMQLLWRYRRPVNIDGLSRFRDNLARGRLARLMRPAVLAFGRPQWVAAPPPQQPLQYASVPFDAARMQEWIDSQVELPLDPVEGPAWHFTAQVFSDGSTVASLVVSHCIADGMSSALAVKEAVHGQVWPVSFPPHTARRGVADVVSELHQGLSDAPATVRALGALLRSARRRGRTVHRTDGFAGEDRLVSLPSVFLRLPVAEWDATARRLGSNRFTLLAAMTSAFAEALGRVSQDQTTLLIPVNQREGLADTGGNRVLLATLKVPRGEAFGRLHALQRQLQTTLLRTRREPDPLSAMLPLVPFVPKRAFVTASRLALGALADMPITCSFVGEWPTDVLKIDGSDADRFCFRGVDRQVTLRALTSRQGVASLPACVIAGDLILNFIAYQPGVVTETRQLQSLVRELLACFGLAGEAFHA